MGLGIKTYLKFKFRQWLDCTPFDGHYNDWRSKRLAAIVNHYGVDFFRGKTVLELGAGYGDIGAFFAMLGADVVCLEGRQRNTRLIRKRYPFVKAITHDLDTGLPGWVFDVIIHMGVLYHLRVPETTLRQVCRCARHVILETEVSDSSDPNLINSAKEAAYNPDQALNGIGSRPSPAWVERVLNEEKMKIVPIRDSRCNSGFHVYDWPVTNTGAYKSGQRRMWFCERK